MTTQERKQQEYLGRQIRQARQKKYKNYIANGTITENDVIEFSVDLYRAMMRAFDAGDLDTIYGISCILKKYGLPQKLRDKIDRIDRAEEQNYIVPFKKEM